MIPSSSLRINQRNIKGIGVIKRLSYLKRRKDHLLNRNKKRNRKIIQGNVVLDKKSGRIFLFKILISDII